jgi:hypothetical protein
MAMVKDIGGLLALTARLLYGFWPQLLLIGTVGLIARELLLNAAVRAGNYSPLAGMIVLSLVVLVKLLVVVLMFVSLRSGLPALANLREPTSPDSSGTDNRRADRLLMVTAAVILPFFAYYAAWGFLGDTVREYSRLAFERLAFGEKIEIFNLMRSSSLVAAILACWFVRWVAKRANDKVNSPWLRLLIVAADASWIFISLFAIDKWKDDLIAWIGAGSLLEGLEASASWFAISAYAAGQSQFIPVEFRQPGFAEQAQNLFFYTLLPMVWLVMASIVYGYDLSTKKTQTQAFASTSTVRSWLNDITAHYLGGYRSRYRPVWNCLKLVVGTGLATLLTFILLYRMTNWIGAWIWYGTTHFLGPYDIQTWQRIGDVLEILFGSPTELDGGIILDAIRIALLAAVLEYSLRSKMPSSSSAPVAAAQHQT